MKKIDPRQQFSKWLARSSAWLLIFYLPALLIVICIQPDAAIACVYLAVIVAFVRIFDAGFYTKNSTTEKVLLNALDKLKLNLTLRGGAGRAAREDQEETEEDPEEGESNG